MDNDILWVWQSFGFLSAVEKAREVIDQLNTEVQSNPRLCIVQLFGSDSGFVVSHAVLAGPTGHCLVALIPEVPFSMTGERGLIADLRGRLSLDDDRLPHGIVVMAETAIPLDAERYLTDDDKSDYFVNLTKKEKDAIKEFLRLRELNLRIQGQTPDELRSAGLKIVSQGLERALKKDREGRVRKEWENLRVFCSEPRHLLRAIPPSCLDIIFGQRLGTLAVDNALAGFTDFMISQWLTEYVLVPLELAILGRKRDPEEGYLLEVGLGKDPARRNSRLGTRGSAGCLTVRAISKAVFPAAGLGTRFLPATKAMPKEMLPLVDKPLIQYAMEEAEAIGIRDVIIVTGRGKTAIEDHFDLSIELDYHLRSKGKVELADELRDLAHRCNIAYIRQHEALGLGHAILQSKALVESEPFAVLLADDVILAEPSCLAQLRQVYEHTGETVIALMQVPIERTSAYGIAWGDPMPEACSDHPVIGFRGVVEKPDPGRAPSNLAVVGRYILHPDIFSDLSAIQPGTNGELQLTDAINRLCQRRPVYGVMFKGRRFDAGDKVGFLLAALEIALDRPDLATSLRQHIERLCMQWIDGR